jgi:hypothetical protein
MSPADQIISEHIHDADRETNENMVHWLHQFIMGNVTQEDLKDIFNYYETSEYICKPHKK